MKIKSGWISARLSAMMFFQYLLFAVWWVPLAAYLTNIGIAGNLKSLILSSMALGCLASPIIGMIADRFFSSEKVLATINAFTAILLLLAAIVDDPVILFWVLFLAMLFYMPSWSLTSSIAMAHIDAEQFPKIRVFGSIGWIASGLFSFIAVKIFKADFDGSVLPFYCGSAVSLIAFIVNLTLPNTPSLAKGTKIATIKDALGLSSVNLIKDPNFRNFLILSFLFMIPFSIYFSYCSEFLLDRGFKYITVSMNWGQVAEVFFILIVPLILLKVGLHRLMLFGLVALIIRYLAFYFGGRFDQPWMYFIGILMHGMIFGFFFLGGQIYIDKKAPPELRSQAQGFYFLITMGLGMVVGNFINGWLIKQTIEVVNLQNVYNWDFIWIITSVISILTLLGFWLFFKVENVDVKAL